MNHMTEKIVIVSMGQHTRLGDATCLVAREWHRTDLAVLSGDVPTLLLEVKAMYSFDAVDSAVGLRTFHRQVLRDRDKSLRPEAVGAEIYALLLVTHPRARCGERLDGVVKYRAAIERAAKRGIERVREDAAEAVSKAFEEFRLITTKGSLEAGTAFGVPVCIDYHLFGPLAVRVPEASLASTTESRKLPTERQTPMARRESGAMRVARG